MATKRAPRKPKTKRAHRKPKEEKAVELRLPPVAEGIDRWLIFGLDPSLSRTGYAFMQVDPSPIPGEGAVDRTAAKWLEVGSVKPESASDPVWVRSKAVALAARAKLHEVVSEHGFLGDLSRTGLIISFEAPTPGNDFLTSISRILHLILFELGSSVHWFGRVHVQMTNAATLRRLMGLVQRGAANKKENVALAYKFLDQGSYPNLDTDACDAVLMAMMARYSASILMGYPHTVPERFLIALCNGETEVVGKGQNAKTRTKGILHRPEYWSRYEAKEYAIQWRDARVKKARLDRQIFTI